MVAAWIKALLFVGGGVTAAAGTAYVTGLLDPWLAPPPQTLAALPDDPAQAPAEQAPPAAVPAVPVPGDPQTTEKQDRLQPPTFDLLRVEPDGSIVIAGKASPEVAVEVLEGERVLARTDATVEGDFVAVFEERLAPGDYQLSLRASRDDEIVVSTETAIVSIPQTADGQVLAMVEEPGKPAEVITAPVAPATPEPAPAAPAEVAAAPAELAPAEAPAGVDEQPADVASAPAEETPAEAPAASEEQPADVAAAPVEAAPAETPAATGEQPADVGAAPVEEAPADAPADAAAPAEEKPAEVAVAPAEEHPVETPAVTEDQPADEQEIAAAPAAPQEEAATPAQPAIVHAVSVEAVEIEGDTVFVAGSATPGLAVRVYANALHLGDSKVSEGGRFLVEARRELPVGDYLIRADLLEADGAVIARAAVPFEREPGESIAAVAPPPPVAVAEPAPAAPEPAPVEDEVAQAPADEDVAAAPADAGDQEAAAPAEPAPPAAKPAEEEDVAAAPPAQPAQPAAPGPAPAEAQPPVAAASPAEPEEQEDEVAAAPAPPPATVPEVTAPKLQPAKGAVIIRRGDNLWRISRRVYGKGVRYSTIYLANQDQITDPDRIWPGQVFGVPRTTAEGEDADLEAMGDQAVSPETESQIIR